MNATDRILGEATNPGQERLYNDPQRAYDHAKYIKGRFPEGEAAIARDPRLCYLYANMVGRFPEGEATLAKEPYWAYIYAYDVLDKRFPEGEAAIANSEYKHRYIQAFPDAKDDWAVNGWIDWLDT